MKALYRRHNNRTSRGKKFYKHDGVNVRAIFKVLFQKEVIKCT